MDVLTNHMFGDIYRVTYQLVIKSIGDKFYMIFSLIIIIIVGMLASDKKIVDF
jgi:hypothetical protein